MPCERRIGRALYDTPPNEEEYARMDSRLSTIGRECDDKIAELTAENEQLRKVVDALMEGVIAADQQPERMESPDMLATLRKLAED